MMRGQRAALSPATSAFGTFQDVNALNPDACFALINGYRESDLSRPKSADSSRLDCY
jgi:hypothetical protein